MKSYHLIKLSVVLVFEICYCSYEVNTNKLGALNGELEIFLLVTAILGSFFCPKRRMNSWYTKINSTRISNIESEVVYSTALEFSAELWGRK